VRSVRRALARCRAFVRVWPVCRGQADARNAGVATGALTAQELRQRGIPLLMLQGGIHPGESDGKDAGFIALRELLGEPLRPDRSRRRRICSSKSRAVRARLQRRRPRARRSLEPAESERPRSDGWRTTSQNVNLNRDYTKAATPEMQAMLAWSTNGTR
jgi:hypothetical protein